MSKLVIVFMCCLAAIEGTGLDRGGWPGYTYYPSLNGWLKLHSEPTEYQDARVSCHLEGTGDRPIQLSKKVIQGDVVPPKFFTSTFVDNVDWKEALLASAWNSDFTKAISQIISLESEDNSPVLYSGSQISFSDGVYRYVKGEPKLSLAPNTEIDLEQCVAFFTNGTIGAVDCKQQLPYVCYAPVPACGDETLAKYNFTCAGYKYASETGHCYKFHSNSVNWTTAYTSCRDEGSHLAVVNSNTEADVLKTLFPSGGTDYASIGYYYWKLSGHWWTIHGQTIQQAGYATWRTNEPTVGSSFSRGFIHREGTLYSYTPQTTAPFICEKAPTLLQS